MTPELYQRAKEIFQGATELSPDEQRAFVDEKAGGNIELKNEVLSLLAHHDEVGAESEGLSVSHKLRNRTPLREVRKFKRRTELPQASNQPLITSLKPQKTDRRRRSNFAYFCIAGLLCLIIFVQFWMVRMTRERLAQQTLEELSVSVNAIKAAIQERCEHLTVVSTQLLSDDVEQRAIELLSQFPSNDDLSTTHQNFSESIALTGLSSDNVVLCNGVGTIVFHQQQPELEATSISADQLPMIVNTLRQQTSTLFIEAVRTEGNESFKPQVWSVVPIQDAKSQLKGILLVSRSIWSEELQSLIQRFSINPKRDCYLVSEQGCFLSLPAKIDLLKNSHAQSDYLSKSQLRVVDPEVDMRTNPSPRALDSLPLTQATYAVVSGLQGCNVEGYRNYVGQHVVGAWAWIDPFKLGLIIEIDYDQAYQSVKPLQWLTGITCLFAALALLALIVARRKLPWSRHKQTETVGPYQLREPIAHGGMGIVYRAQHELLKRPSAVKVIRSDRLSADEVARFEREVRVASRLHCPHTISIFDFGQSAEGQWYFAMEYLDGMTLEQLVVRHGTLSVDRTIHILIQIGESLHEAHEQGLVHRDIKPQNVMLTCRGSSPDFAVVFDFGLAKPMIPDGSLFMTGERVWAGTPSYMSPERIRSPGLVDARADIYSFGVLAYYMLVGHEPFTAADPGALFEQVLTVIPPPPSRDAERFVPATLDRLVLNCLEKNPDSRPRSVAAILETLDELAREYPWNRQVAARWWKEHFRTLDSIGE